MSTVCLPKFFTGFWHSGGHALLEFPAGLCDVGSVEDGRHGANPLRSGPQYFVQVPQVDAPDDEPRYLDVRRGPAHITHPG